MLNLVRTSIWELKMLYRIVTVLRDNLLDILWASFKNEILISNMDEWNKSNLPIISLPINTAGSKIEEGTEADLFRAPLRVAYSTS